MLFGKGQSSRSGLLDGRDGSNEGTHAFHISLFKRLNAFPDP